MVFFVGADASGSFQAFFEEYLALSWALWTPGQRCFLLHSEWMGSAFSQLLGRAHLLCCVEIQIAKLAC